MSFVTIETVTASLNNADWAISGDANLSVILANAWLAEKRLPPFEVVPTDVLMAGSLIAQAIANGEMYQGRTDGIVVSKSVKADDILSSKTYASGADGQAITAAEQQALLLIAPYINARRFMSVPVVRA